MKKRLLVSTGVVVSLAALIGVARAVLLQVSLIPPLITYVSSSTTATTYNPVSQVFSVAAPDVNIQFTPTEPTLSVLPPRSMTISIKVDNTGALIGSVGPGPDLVITGKVTRIVGTTTNVYSGLLLTGKIYAFGYQYLGSGVADFDFRFTPTGGLLQPFYACDHVGITLDSESSTFTGSFATNFQGQAKGNVGLEDLIPPSVTCPSNIVVQCNTAYGGQHGAFVTYPNPVGSDNCSTNVTFVYAPPSGSFFALNPTDISTNYTVTLTAIDGGANSNTCTFTVTVEDTTPPVLDVADPIIGQCEISPFVLTNDIGQCSATFTFEKPTAFDLCCTNNLTVTVSAVDQSNAVIILTDNGDGTMTGHFPVTCPGGTNVITSVATDGRGNTAQAQCDVIVLDVQPPVITCPSNQVVECTANTPAGGAVHFQEPTVYDNCPNLTTSCMPTNGSVLPLGTNAIVFTAADCSGNANSCTFYVIVQDTTAPTISCPANITLQCGQSTNVSVTGTATAGDTCDSSPVVTYTDAAGPVNCTGLASINRTWTATDASGNSVTCVQTIAFTNTTPPTVTVPTGSNLGCNPANLPTEASVQALVTVVSACSTPTVNVSHSDSTSGCSVTRTFTVTATDACGNTSAPQTVVYTWTADTTAPTVTVPTGSNLGCNPATLPTVASVQALVTATDSCSTPTVNVTSSDSTSGCSVTRTFTVTATDACGNTSAPQTVVYTWTIDTTAPTVTVPTGSNLGCNPATLPTVASVKALVTATDSCSTPTVNVTSSDSTSGCTVTRTFTVTATDACGNTSAPQTVVYSWTVDTTAPSITCPAPVTVYCASNVPPVNVASVTAVANCGTATVTWVSDVITNKSCPNRYTVLRTYKAVDPCGNSATCTQTITVNDTVAPTINCPTNITVFASPYCTNTVRVSSSCPNNILKPSCIDTNLLPSCGNTGSYSCSCSNAVLATNPQVAAFLNSVTAADNCGSGATVTNNAPASFSVGTNTVTFTATDSCGNTNNCQAKVTVVAQVPNCEPIQTSPSFCYHAFDGFGRCQFATFAGNLTLTDGDQPSDFRTASNAWVGITVTSGTNSPTVLYCSQMLMSVIPDGCGGEAWEYYSRNPNENVIFRFTDNQVYNSLMDPNLPQSSATKNKNVGKLSTVQIGALQTKFYYAFQYASQPITIVVDGIALVSVSNYVASSALPFTQCGATAQITLPERLVPGNTIQWYATGDPTKVSTNNLLYTQVVTASGSATATYVNEGAAFSIQLPAVATLNYGCQDHSACVNFVFGQAGVSAKVGCGTFCQGLPSSTGTWGWEWGQCSGFDDQYGQECWHW
ncbi:MAG TPA: HYR domain-containing protein [Verrucomicrobiae bacterium]|nr:HYR domain-containing protein [Verrucomicrobiae bacterium]